MSQPQPEIEALQSELRELRAKLEAYKNFSEIFEKQCEDFIFHFFKEDRDISIEDLMHSFSEKRCVCEAVVSRLIGKGMIKDLGCRPLPRYALHPEVLTTVYRLTSKATEWVLANQSKK